MTTRTGAPQIGQRGGGGGGWLSLGGLHHQQAEGREREGTAGMEKAEVANFHKAIGQDVLEEPAEKLHDVELGGAEAGTADFPVGEGDCAVRERDKTAVGDGDPEDIGGQVGEGGMAVVIGLTVDVPGNRPGLRIDLLQKTGLAHLFFEDGAVDGGERFDRDKEVGPGGQPGRAVLGEAPTRDNGVNEESSLLPR